MQDDNSKQKSLHSDYGEQSREREKGHRFSLTGSGWGKGFVSEARLDRRMLKPYFWPNWLGVFLYFLLVTVLPYRLQMLLGRVLGRLYGRLTPNRTYVLRRNLELAYPQLDEAQRERLKERVLESSGMAIFEVGMAWFWPDWRLKRLAIISSEDLERGRALAAQNKPVIVLTCHYVTLEIMARLYALYIKPGIGVYRPSDHPVWEYTQVKGRLRNNLALVNAKDPRSMIKALMNRVPIWYAPDQDYGAKASVFVPFFGVDKAATVVGTHNLAKVKDTVVQPSFTVREHGKYHLYVWDTLENFPTEDAQGDARRCNEVLEKMISLAPEQYLWLHRRFKTVPEGEDSRYPDLK